MTTQELQSVINDKAISCLDKIKKAVLDPRFLNIESGEYRELIVELNESLRMVFEVKNLIDDVTRLSK